MKKTSSCALPIKSIRGQINHLNLFILIFGVRSPLVQYLVLNIFAKNFSHVTVVFNEKLFKTCSLIFELSLIKSRISCVSIHTLRTENTKEFLGLPFMSDIGITHQTPCLTLHNRMRWLTEESPFI